MWEENTLIEIDLNDLCEDMEKKEIPDPKLMLTEDIGVMVTPLKLKDAAAANVVAEKRSSSKCHVFYRKGVYKGERCVTL